MSSIIGKVRPQARLLLCCLVAVPSLLMVSLRAQPDTRTAARPILLELFTSQSCSSCPPADAYLGELSQRDDVLALSFHVDYWNGLGWHDRFSSAQYTERQQSYAGKLRANVYTPQLVIDGAREAVGSDRGAVEAAIRGSQRDLRSLTLNIEKHGRDIDMQFGDPQEVPGDAELLLVTFDPSVTQAIRGGENSGRTVAYHNVVRSARLLGTPAAAKLSTALRDDETGADVALIVQEQSGRVIGVATAR